MSDDFGSGHPLYDPGYGEPAPIPAVPREETPTVPEQVIEDLRELRDELLECDEGTIELRRGLALSVALGFIRTRSGQRPSVGGGDG